MWYSYKNYKEREMWADIILQAGETGKICYKYARYLAHCLAHDICSTNSLNDNN